MLKQFDTDKATVNYLDPIFSGLYRAEFNINTGAGVNIEDKDRYINYINENAIKINLKKKKIKIKFNLNHSDEFKLETLLFCIKHISKIKLKLRNKKGEVLHTVIHRIRIKDFDLLLDCDKTDLCVFDTIFKIQ